jgi:hypothetical protein
MNFYLPKRKKREPLGLKEPTVIRCPGHLQFVRLHDCCASGKTPNMECAGRIEAAHVRTGTDGGTSMKPSDRYTIPLCSCHHHYQHQIGEAEFERKTGLKMRLIADALWANSPAGRKYERKQEGKA